MTDEQRQPCQKFLDIWRVGDEWLKIPDGAVCPRCGFMEAEHEKEERPCCVIGCRRSATDHSAYCNMCWNELENR